MTLGLRIDNVTHIENDISRFSVDIIQYKVKNGNVYVRMKVWDGDDIILEKEKIINKVKKNEKAF